MKSEHSKIQPIDIGPASVESADKLIEPVYRVVQDLGFQYFSHFYETSNRPSKSTSHSSLFLTSARNNWGERYMARNYSHLDPAMGRNENLPFTWGGTRCLRSLPQSARVVMEGARDHGLESAVSVPVHGPDGEFGVFSLSCN